MGVKSAFTPGCAVNQIILFQSTNRTTLSATITCVVDNAAQKDTGLQSEHGLPFWDICLYQQQISKCRKASQNRMGEKSAFTQVLR
jgi:hypothetical protein